MHAALRFALTGILIASAWCASAQTKLYSSFERQSLYVPVRDGTRLAVNIYRPADDKGVERARLPVIFAFTPYRARFTDARGVVQETALSDGFGLRSLIRAGYVVAVADIRGKGASYGARRGFQDRTEAMDGHDLVEWLARRPFSSGKVGMVGCSYLGGTVMHTASTTPPSLKAVFAGATDWDKYEFVAGGGITAQFNTRPDEPLADDLASLPVDADKSRRLLKEAVQQHAGNTPMAPLWYGMPFRDSISSLTGNAFWDEVAIWKHAGAIRKSGIATYLWSNWKDEPTSQVIVAAENLGSRLLIGPGSHCAAPAGFDLPGEITRYFDYHLKGVANGFDQQPRVTYWQDRGDGTGRYVRDDKAPGGQPLTLSFYLANQSNALLAKPHDATERSFTVDYEVADKEYFAFWPPSLDGRGPHFDSAPLTSPIDLLGYPIAHLAVQLDRPDANLFVYLEEVGPQGKVEVLSFGRLKVSHRSTSPAPWNSFGLPWHSGLARDVKPLPAGEVARLAIAMQPLSRRVPAGFRLRLLVTGADPRQRNLAAIRETPPPVFTLLDGWEGGSRIDLPMVQLAK